MDYIYWLSQIKYSEQSLVGDKLYILSQLLQHEIPILPGFVLGNNLLRQFLTNLDDFKSLIRELSAASFHLDADDYLTLQSVANRSRRIIERAVFPAKWQAEIFEAARQLNSHSLILQPFFTVPYGQDLSSRGIWRSHTCSLHPQALSKAIKQVWSELFTAKSLWYRHKLGLSREGSNLAILIRPLKNTLASGVIEIDSNIIKIRATWGLEQSLLQGEVEPDEYYLDRHTGYLLERHLGQKNYGYRLANIDSKTWSVDCLETYIPSEAQTESYVLEAKAIALLHQLTEDILQQQPKIKSLVWTAPEIESSAQNPYFYFTQFSQKLTTSVALVSRQVTSVSLASTTILPLLTAVSAAPGEVTAQTVVIKDFAASSKSIPANSILVTNNITPQNLALIKQVKGIITETGGLTSHGAIIARELNIPAIVNAVDATTILQDDVEVFLSGDEGKVYPANAAKQLSLTRLSGERLLSRYESSIATKLMVNISQPESIAHSLNLPVDGVGLLRSELLLGDILTEQSTAQWRSESFKQELLTKLTESLRQFVSAFAPRPVFYRSIDLTTEETTNPILGNRGTYSYYFEPSLFSLELEALSAIATEGYSNLNLILPFVRSVEEFKFCYRQLENIGLAARNSFQVWIMAEVPSVIWLLPEYIRAGVRGIAIGTNDLTQLVLGVDREQAQFSTRGLNANHPAVQQAIAQLIAVAKKHHLDCSICGQAPVEYPALIDKLVEWGITAISVEPGAVTRTYRAIARAEKRILLDSLKDNKLGQNIDPKTT